MNQVKETIIGFLLGISVYTFLVEVVGIVFSNGRKEYTLGLLIGVGVAIILFFHMTRTLDKALDLPPEQATKYVKRQAFLRLFFMLVALLLVIILPDVNFIAAVLGMLGLKIGAYIAPKFLVHMYPEDFVTQLEDGEDIL